MSTEKKKKRRRHINILILTLIAILLATVFMFRYTHQAGIGMERYSVYIEDEACTVIVNETLQSKLDIYIDSQQLYDGYEANYTVLVEKNITFYVTPELESTPKIDFKEKESSIIYQIRIENGNFSWAMITFFELYYSEGRLLRNPDWVMQIIIREHFTSFFMQFETFKEDEQQ
ncbi:MAG: hypothetical protein ACUVRA_05710 [Candidatus Bathyarchaeaceae archaeon]